MRITKPTYLILVYTCILLSCGQDKQFGILTPNRVSPPELVSSNPVMNAENIGRSSWQKPELVVNKLGDLEGKTVADIGAGTGYFVFRLAYKKAKVIAIDIDPLMIEFIDGFKENLPVDIRNNVSTRLGKYESPNLGLYEVDQAIIINTISYIEEASQYLKNVLPGIRPGGKIMILDYKTKKIAIPAPDMEDRLSIGTVEQYLEAAGFINIVSDDSSLDYQYIVTAEVPK